MKGETDMKINNTVKINGIDVEIGDEKNLLELIRKAGIEIPTFCYHSELSVYGACRLCIVEVDGKGIMASCSTAPEPGMVIHTDTKEIREFRKINVELLLANHDRECPTCPKSSHCALQDLGRRLGVEKVRFKENPKSVEIDMSSPSLTRDPNKCVLCGDCVRVCKEVQGIGAIDFANRGSKSCVAPAFNDNLANVECVNCGQCAAVCPTGAIIPRQDAEKVWDAIYDKDKIVVAQIAPAVRVALGEYFGIEPGANVAGKLVKAMKIMGFDLVFDTSFTADMTIFEEATEFIDRFKKADKLPLITSCCPAWVKFAEIYFPELLHNISTCKSPQQMFGSVAKKVLPAQTGIKRENIVVVSVMPCTAKKFEATLPKFKTDGIPDVDHVITTVEIGRMINSMGIKFNDLEPEAFDMPMGFATGGGVIFGATGGVMEAALRYAVEKVEGKKLKNVDFKAVRGMEKIKEAEIDVAGTKINVAVVNGLVAAREVATQIAQGKSKYHFVEVMACPGGCIAGGGQPGMADLKVRQMRAQGLYQSDKNMQLQKSQDNYLVEECYKENFEGCPGSHAAHHALHTHYKNRSQIFDAKVPVIRGTEKNSVPIIVTICANREDCPGHNLLARVVKYVKDNGWENKVNIDAAFSSRQGPDAPICVTVGDEVLDSCVFRNPMNTEEEIRNRCEFESVRKAMDACLKT